MTAAEALDRAKQEGRQAALDGQPFSSNPFVPPRWGHPVWALSVAWRAGYTEGEIEADDAAGDLFRGTAR